MLTEDDRERILGEARDGLVSALPQAVEAIRAALAGSCLASPQKLAAASAVLQGLGAIGAGGEDFDEAAMLAACDGDEEYPAADETIPAKRD